MSEPASGTTERLFVAVWPPDPVRVAATDAMRACRGAGDVKWVADSQLHLTLKFLGEVTPEQQRSLPAVLQEIANDFSHFMVHLSGVGAFPDLRRPRTLWLGLEPSPDIQALVDRVEDGMLQVRIPRADAPYRAHLTLGRVRSVRGAAALSARFSAWRGERVAWPVQTITLVRSELRTGGAEYTTLGSWALRADGAEGQTE